ncbi:hypothetical protein NC652_014460 [Populus alba x Populus x berolinensis]|nr:hypothetical protein NC652_014460 [Populus alba x Populus x berolinensis]
MLEKRLAREKKRRGEEKERWFSGHLFKFNRIGYLLASGLEQYSCGHCDMACTNGGGYMIFGALEKHIVTLE